jgi:adenosine 3'-phospho 5'-phosphosulfate transporter B3
MAFQRTRIHLQSVRDADAIRDVCHLFLHRHGLSSLETRQFHIIVHIVHHPHRLYCHLSLADSRNPPPQRLYFIMGCLLVVSFGMSNMSLLYLTYPTKVILKACKLIPVMLLGLSVQGRGYNSREYASAFALVVGLAFFTLGDKIWLLIAPATAADSSAAAAAVSAADAGKSTPLSLLIGVFLMSLSLVADSYLGNLQERTLAKHRCTPQQLVFYNSTVGAGILAIVTLFNGELYAAVVYSVARLTILRVLVLTFVGYLGVSVYLVLVKTSGIFVATIVATIRKFITILLSFVFFPKPFSLAHGVGLVAVAVGIALNLQTKSPHKR